MLPRPSGTQWATIPQRGTHEILGKVNLTCQPTSGVACPLFSLTTPATSLTTPGADAALVSQIKLTYSGQMASAGAPPINDAFGVIAHPVRRQIVAELALGAKAVRDLTATLPVTRPAVSQHLKVMLDVGLVTQERVGRENHYQLHPERLDEVRNWLAVLDASWAGALKRLGQHLERTP